MADLGLNPDQAAAAGDETGAAGDQTGAAGDETGAAEDQTGAAGDETGAAGDQTVAAGDETAAAPNETGATGPAIGRRASLGRLFVAIGVANAALYAMYIGILQVLLPLQVEAIDRAHKVAALGLISGIAAIFAAIFNPLGGAFSDRTRSRFGRRAPWLLGASLAVVAALAVLASASSVVLVIVGWSLTQAVANVYQAALTAVVPDRVPATRRGAASGVIGVATSVGAVAGVGLADGFSGHLAWGYLTLGVVLAITAIGFVTATADPVASDRPARAESAPSRGLIGKLADFTSALRSPDFAWVFAGRAALILGYFLVAGFELYILTDYVALPAGLKPATGVTILAAASTLCAIAAAAIAGPWSDRAGRRKPFVFVSAAISGLAMGLPILSPTFPVMIVFAVLSGLAFGSYMAVDVALVTLVLPRREDAARDMGVLNVANAGPQIVAPFLAALIIGHLGGYPALFVAGGVVAIGGAFAIVPVKSVR